MPTAHAIDAFRKSIVAIAAQRNARREKIAAFRKLFPVFARHQPQLCSTDFCLYGIVPERFFGDVRWPGERAAPGVFELSHADVEGRRGVFNETASRLRFTTGLIEGWADVCEREAGIVGRHETAIDPSVAAVVGCIRANDVGNTQFAA